MNVEPTKILIDLASKLYKTNIEIIFFDGTIYDSKDSALLTSKTSFQYNDNPRNPKITLFYKIATSRWFLDFVCLCRHNHPKINN